MELGRLHSIEREEWDPLSQYMLSAAWDRAWEYPGAREESEELTTTTELFPSGKLCPSDKRLAKESLAKDA